MQVLLSRTAKARTTCRCISCGQAAKTVARRTTKSSPQRRIGANDIFTACYSSLIASAVLADAEVKRKRRREWDQAIEDAQSEEHASESGRTEAEISLRTWSPLSAQGASLSENGTNAANSWQRDNTAINVTSKSPLEGKLRTLLAQVEQSLQSTKVTIDPGDVSEIALQNKDEVIEEWADVEGIDHVGLRDCKKKVHFERIEGTMTRLIGKLLQRISVFSDFDAPSPSSSSERTQAILKAIRKLQEGTMVYPNYSITDMTASHETRAALHKSIYKICQRAKVDQPGIDLMLAKICYNLLISSAPPSIVTFNILLGEFTKLRLYEEAELIITSYCYDSILPPTMETPRLMLDHYIAHRDRAGFMILMNRMSASLASTSRPLESTRNVQNMRLGRRNLEDLYRPDIKKWASRFPVISRNGALFRQGIRDTMIFDRIIWGSLEMVSTFRATLHLIQAIQECKVKGVWILAVAERCLQKLDHESAILLLEALSKHWRDESGRARFRFTDMVRNAIQQLLALCGIDSSQMFPHLKHFPFIAHQNLNDLLLHSHLEAAHENLRRISADISALRDSLNGVVSASPTGAMDNGMHSSMTQSIAMSSSHESNSVMPAHKIMRTTLSDQSLFSSFVPRKRFSALSRSQIQQYQVSFLNYKLSKLTDRFVRYKREADTTIQNLSRAPAQAMGDVLLAPSLPDVYVELPVGESRSDASEGIHRSDIAAHAECALENGYCGPQENRDGKGKRPILESGQGFIEEFPVYSRPAASMFAMGM